MAKKITKDEIFEDGLFKGIIEDAEKAIVVFDKLDRQIVDFVTSIKKSFDGVDKETNGGIKNLINLSKELNAVALKTLDVEKQKLLLEREIIKNQDRVNLSKKEQLSAEQSLQRQRERSIAQMEREAKKVAEAERPYNKMSATLNDLRKKYKDLAVTGNENTASARAMKREIDSLDKALKKADGSVGQFQRNVGNYPQMFRSIGSALAHLGLGFGVFSSIKGIAETEVKLQSLQLALKNVMGTQERYNQSFAFLSELSRNYGQDLTVLVDTYKGFIASSESSNLSLEARNKIYQSVIKSGSSLALSNDQIQGSLLAISQMFSKGTVSAEELRGQLGERLPGAFGIMAKSMGVSEQQLGKMMQKGEVMAKDVLPKFAEELEKTFGANASKNLETIGGAWNVLQTEISLYINEANKGGAITKQIASAIGFLATNIDTIITVLGKAIKAWITFKTVMYAMNLKEQYSQWKGLEGAVANTADGLEGAVANTADGLVKAEKGAGKFGNALKGIGLTVFISLLSEAVMGLYDIASGAKDAQLAVEQMNKAVSNGKNFGSGVISDLASRKTALDARLKNKKITQKQYEDELNDLKQASYKRVAWEIKVEKEEIANAKAKIAKLKPIYDQVMAINPLFRDDAMMRIVANYNSENSAIKQSLSSIEALTIGYQGLDFEITDNIDLTKKETKEVKDKTKAIEDYTIRVKELQNARIVDDQQRKTAELELKYTIDLASIKGDGIKANELRIELEKQYISDLKDLQIEFDKIRNEENDKKVKFINDQHLLDIENQIQAKEIEMQIELNNADSEKEKLQIRKIYGDEIRNLKIKQLEEQKQIELKNYELTEKEKLAIQQKYDLEILKLKEGTIQAEDEAQKKADEKEKKRLEEMRNFRRRMLDELLDELKRQSEAREATADKDIQTQKDFQAQLQAQANAGNITAQQSIAQSIENEKKATLAKEKEQKKQQRIDDMKTLFNLINQNIDKGDNAGIATVKATASMALIKSIAGMFKGFAKGTKWRLGQEDNPLMSGVDGHVVRVDSSEAIVNGGLMNKAEKAGIRSTEQLVNSAIMYQTFNPNSIKMNDDRQAFNSASIEPITQRLESLEQTIKNKTEFRIEPYILHGIHKGIVQIQKDGNLTRKTIIKS